MLSNILATRINNIIKQKKTNVILSADLTNTENILDLVNKINKDILGIKLHSDIIKDVDHRFYDKLKKISQEKNFIIIEDRKFCDIGNTCHLQSNIITNYADLITVHSLPGQGIIDGLKDNCIKNCCCILLIAQMSSSNNLIDDKYTKETITLARNNKDIVLGFIGQEKLGSNFLTFCPGVKLYSNSDMLGQTYNTPDYLVNEKGVDILIVGRGIYESSDPVEEIKNYIYLKNNSLLQQLKDHKIIKYGNFTFKSGLKSPVYIDCREIMGYPKLMKDICKNLYNLIENQDVILVGVPIGGISFSCCISTSFNIPMIILRDKPKEHGRCKLIEGLHFDKKCVIIEDVITTGGSVIESIKKLEGVGLQVSEVIAILDWEKGGKDNIRNMGYSVKTLFKASDLL